MFVKLTRSGSHAYAQLVESFRDESGKPRQRTVATIGRVDETDGAVDSLLKGLLRARGKPADLAAKPQVEFESALALGDVWALDQLWKELGFEGLARVFRKARYTTPVEHALREFAGRRLTLKQLYEQHSVGRRFILRNYRDVVRILEANGRVTLTPPAAKRQKRKGEVTVAEHVAIDFPQGRSSNERGQV